MATTIYVCEQCLFSFERVGTIENCPDCGKAKVRPADTDEQSQYFKIKAELKEQDQ